MSLLVREHFRRYFHRDALNDLHAVRTVAAPPRVGA